MNDTRPNIIFIMSDDHAAHAMSCYDSRINQTPNLDRIANEGTRFDNCFCTNSICAPSRATILTGLYNHINGVKTLRDSLDNRITTFPSLLQKDGYQTSIIGKWHLGHGPENDPAGFDHWSIFPGQGSYFNPTFIENGVEKKVNGYVTDVVTDLSIDWMNGRDRERPFLLLCHHKAPHRHWLVDEKHAHLYEDTDIPEPPTFDDDYSNRSKAAAAARMTIERDMNEKDYKVPLPAGLTERELKSWKYQRYIKDYLRCIASIDDNVGRILDYLDDEGLTDNTIVIYTSDQGFFLGEHGWYDKRFMYEESLRMPFIVRYPKEIKPGSTVPQIAVNVDFAPTLLDYAGAPVPEEMQGYSLRPLLNGETTGNWRTAMYYRYWMHLAQHNVCAHYGIRTDRYKLIYYYGEALGATGAIDESWTPEWELFDLECDPMELNNVHADSAYSDIVKQLHEQLESLRREIQDLD
ncbi:MULTISPECIES: sulfatase family protein [Paenibacillus]|uniref:sulfatase family protein n=1 Tax=Paenibacillus TaxID=44249 RepID=UPI0011A7A1F4|nr:MULTISPECIES: sulfatase [Paenibacillus]MBJ9992317.1 sulfatase [Paenibacillus sp. S28]